MPHRSHRRRHRKKGYRSEWDAVRAARDAEAARPETPARPTRRFPECPWPVVLSEEMRRLLAERAALVLDYITEQARRGGITLKQESDDRGPDRVPRWDFYSGSLLCLCWWPIPGCCACPLDGTVVTSISPIDAARLAWRKYRRFGVAS